MRTGSRQTLSLLALIAGAVIFLVAALLGGGSWMTFGGLAAGVGVLGMLGGERGVPSATDTEAFLLGLVRGRGFGGAFELRELRHEVFTGGSGARLLVRFGAEVEFTEPLYRAADPPAALFEGFSARRVGWVRKMVAQLAEEGVAGAAELRGRAPPDPFQRRHVAVKTSKGTKVRISGTATAAAGAKGWVYNLEELGGGLGPVAELGEPAGALGEPLILNHRDSERWVRETIVAWRRYEREVQALRRQAEAARSDHASRAIEVFFAGIKAGTFFHGTGEAASRQQAPAYFFLEVVSVDEGAGEVVLLLRNDGAWEQSRRFVGKVGYNEGEHVVEVHAVTKAEEACANGGPVVGTDGAFTVCFHFTAGVPSLLSTFGGDLTLMLEETPREALDVARARAYGRRQRLVQAITAGTVYAGPLAGIKGGADLTLTFVPGADRGGVMARLETAGWSGLFTVQERCNQYEASGYDLVLEPVLSPTGDGGGDPAAPGRWRRVGLKVEEGQVAGVIEAEGRPLQVTLRKGPLARPAAKAA